MNTRRSNLFIYVEEEWTDELPVMGEPGTFTESKLASVKVVASVGSTTNVLASFQHLYGTDTVSGERTIETDASLIRRAEKYLLWVLGDTLVTPLNRYDAEARARAAR